VPTAFSRLKGLARACPVFFHHENYGRKAAKVSCDQRIARRFMPEKRWLFEAFSTRVLAVSAKSVSP